MDFGRLEPAQLATVDFSLPPDSDANATVLSGTKVAAPRVYVGCPIWTNKTWVGKIYPTGLKEKDFLPHYARQFNTIELNTTHYRIPDPETVARWKASAPPGFTFCPKIPQVISHDRQLQSVGALVAEFCEAVAGLGEHLGTTFLQLPPYFGPAQWPALVQFVQHYPPAIPLAVEFRHPDWFAKPAVWQRALDLLRHHGVSTVVTDVAGRRDVLHQNLTTTTAVIRYVGNMPRSDDYTRLDAWVQRVSTWLAQGLETLYFFVHEHDNIISPEVVRYVVRQLNRQCGLCLREPTFVVQAVQGRLF